MKTLSGLFSRFFIAAFVGLSLFLSLPGFASDPPLDLQSILHDTQQIKYEGHQMIMAWWVPEQYWRASLARSSRLTKSQIASFLQTVKPYTVVIVVRGTFDPHGNSTFEDEDSLRSTISLIDTNRVHYAPIDNLDLNKGMQAFLTAMKPILANMLGSLGKNFDFFVFTAVGKNGKLIADARQEGVFSVAIGEDQFRWRLPLGSVLPPKTCPKCTEVLSGAYKFCPYDGTPLDY
jgi:hypothetical protein